MMIVLCNCVTEASLRTGNASRLDFAGAMTLEVQVILIGKKGKMHTLVGSLTVNSPCPKQTYRNTETEIHTLRYLMPLLIQILLLQHFFVYFNCIIMLVQTQLSQLICAFELYVSINPMLGCRSFPLVQYFSVIMLHLKHMHLEVPIVMFISAL
jgi:hypothetical protein